MPSVKQGGGYTLTFAKKNSDVKDILDNEKENGTVITNYICDAIRFYHYNKDVVDVNISKDDIESIIAKKVNEILQTKISDDIQDSKIGQVEEVAEAKVYNLEDSSGIDEFDLEED
ncbi:MAG: hypothetical protein ACRDB9_07590 [Cetobacterium sp.]